jgi:prevent-host-death family protein
MAKVGIRDLKQNASAVVAEAASGETVVITDRGRPVAQLSPLPTSRLAGLIASGRARPARRALRDLPEAAEGVELSPTLETLRRGERF